VKARLAGAPRRLGAGVWRVDVDLHDDASGYLPLGSDALEVQAEGAGVAVQAVVAPPPGASGRWGLVLALPPGASRPATAEVRVAGHSLDEPLQIVLGDSPWEEPAPTGSGAAASPVLPLIDYTARDFDAVRAAMIDSVRGALGAHPVVNVVAQTTALIEVLAYLADGLSYAQDAVSTEAYLASARRRISVARHARLLGYQLQERVSARVWVRIEAHGSAPFVLPRHTQLLSRVPGLGGRLASDEDVLAALDLGAQVFETVSEVTLHPGAAALPLHEGTHPGGRLRHGATSATVVGGTTTVRAGDVVLLRAAGAAGGHVVRLTSVEAGAEAGELTELRWEPEDALPRSWPEGREASVHPHNLVLADHGRTIPRHRSALSLIALPSPVEGRRYWPRLPDAPVAFRPADREEATSAFAAAAGHGPPLPAIHLEEETSTGRRRWTPKRSLLDSGPNATDFVAEIDNDGSARLRFGDGNHGLQPADSSRFSVRYRVGGGSQGNVAAGSIGHVVSADPRVVGATNPTAAAGGVDPEPITAVRVRAPEASRRNDRAVTERDIIRLALAVPGIVDADCAWQTNGSWPVAVVPVALAGGWDDPGAALDRLQEFLAARRLVGTEIEVRRAAPVAADIEFAVTVGSGWEPGMVRARVDAVLRDQVLSPLRFRFGVPLHPSEVVAGVLEIRGVTDVTVLRFGVYGEAEADAIRPGFGEVIRIDNDPSAPERGRVRYRLVSSEH
jgi:hypothetical protein